MRRVKDPHEICQGGWCRCCGGTVRPVWDADLEVEDVDRAASVRRVCYCDPLGPTVWVDD